MIKVLAIVTAVTAFALSSSFAGDCGGGSCSGKSDKKKEGSKEGVAQVFQF